jgi:hypothetical protein
MTLDDLIIIACMVLLVVCCGGYRYLSWNVYLKTKYRRSPTGRKFLINGGKTNGNQVKRGRNRQILHCAR